MFQEFFRTVNCLLYPPKTSGKRIAPEEMMGNYITFLLGWFRPIFKGIFVGIPSFCFKELPEFEYRPQQKSFFAAFPQPLSVKATCAVRLSLEESNLERASLDTNGTNLEKFFW